MAFWTAQFAECVEENVDKRNQVGAVAVLPSIHLHQSQGGPRPLNLSSRQSVAQRRDLRFHFRQKRMCRGRIASRFRFSIKANRRSLGYARDDKVEGGGPPWHWWRWMDGSTALAPTRFRLSTFSSTHSASCAFQKAICALIWTALAENIPGQGPGHL